MSKDNLLRRLDILESLLESATPTEKAYYSGLKEKFERQITRFESKQETASEETPESLADVITEGYKGLFWFEYELSRDLDSHWHAYFTEQKEQRIAALQELEEKLKATGFDYTPPQYDRGVEEADAQAIDHEVRVDELKHFRRLLTSWAERNGQPESEIPELADIDRELHELTQHSTR
ncbi:hypothetical protein [Deinococcus enclensis]|uniref:Uncharacterized protein n=1 Tax=Deinococcus enclensis TaxID=1049582 RepID=A0ABT9MHT0_9DEIO|nr:hypothetical protein [Deinococcus enclensis]MDP9766148.1 hypothetical protein [Deinococcus enclensis]